MNIRNVRERVIKRLNIIRNPDEEQIHAAYSREIQTELDTAAETAKALRTLFVDVRARRPDGAWVMVERADIEHFDHLVEQLLLAMR